MSPMKFVKGLAVSLACCGMLAPEASLFAASPQPAAKAGQKAPIATDLVLGAGGTLTGQVVNAQGAALDGASVVLSQSGREVARTTSNKDGRFSFREIRGGQYAIVAGQGQGLYRVWTTKTAPPSAKTQALLVSGKSVRGQGGFVPVDAITATTVVLGGVAAGFSIAAFSEASDTNDKIDNLEDQINSPN